jgi:TolB-like protein
MEVKMSFLWELKRRNIFKAAFAYIIAAWLLDQIAARFILAQHLPEWIDPLIIILLIIGFPVVIIFAWIKYAGSDSDADEFLYGNGVKEKPKTVAVLPFANLSPDPGQEYFVDGLSEELLNRLTKIPELFVTARTSSFAFKGSDKNVQEIAKIIGVDHILEGSVRKVDKSLRITAQLVRASDGFYLWSKTYNRKLEDIFAVQEDIANAVANELKASLGIKKSLRSLGGTENLEAYEHYLFAEGQLGEGNLADLSRSLKSIDAALEKDPTFALAWVRKSVIHNFLAANVSSDRITTEQDAGLQAAQKAIDLEPSLAEAYASLGHNRTFRGDWIDAELAFRKAFELAAEPIAVTVPAIPIHYLAVGNFERGHKLLEEIRRDDPFNNPNRAWYFFSFGLLGDTQRAEEEFDRGRELFGDQWYWGNFFVTLLRLGSGEAVSQDDILIPDSINISSKELLESPGEALKQLRRLYTHNDNQSAGRLSEIAVWAAYFGDPEFALDAIEKAVILNASNIVFLWFPLFRVVRQLPRFKEFVKKIGLQEYWKKFGWPDFCQPIDDDDFECP